MPGKRHSPEQILEKLREADELKLQGTNARGIARRLGIAENTYLRWRQLYGRVDGSQKRRLIELEEENGRLRHIVAELSIDLQRVREKCRSAEIGSVGGVSRVLTAGAG